MKVQIFRSKKQYDLGDLVKATRYRRRRHDLGDTIGPSMMATRSRTIGDGDTISATEREREREREREVCGALRVRERDFVYNRMKN